MEELFGISYPTVKNRLNRIARQLESVDISPPASAAERESMNAHKRWRREFWLFFEQPLLEGGYINHGK